MNNVIDLSNYKKSSNSVYTGRPQGNEVRKKINLEKKDKDSVNYNIKFAANTLTINLSFFLGLFYDSIRVLGLEKFNSKYTFDLTNLPSDVSVLIRKDIDDALRNAGNSLEGNSILDFFN